MMKAINPEDTPRAQQFEIWKNAPNPMLVFVKKMDVTNLVRLSKKHQLKFNMLLDFCIGKAALVQREFYLLPVGGQLMQFDQIAVNTMVKNHTGEVSSCDIAFDGDFEGYNRDYLRYTREVAATCVDRDLSATCMVIGTSAVIDTELVFAGGMYCGIYNNPFIMWGRYSRRFFSYYLNLSFQFHHTQMDGAHASAFLERLQYEIHSLRIR
ncbi:chloramphenicol O-acetyltransferase [gut metagenome]|uniref:Chloramphenicol O-acetyltransferase n=1 Tax=gut metagenome TaxID=749906 RepID=J9GZV7_9ZZZZ